MMVSLTTVVSEYAIGVTVIIVVPRNEAVLKLHKLDRPFNHILAISITSSIKMDGKPTAGLKLFAVER